MKNVCDVQRKVLKITEETNKLRYSLVRLRSDLEPEPEDEDWDRMAEDEIPPSLAFHLHGLLGIIEEDVYKDASEALLEAALTTQRRLREEWERDQKSFELEAAKEREEARAPSLQ